jgi:hypothetical protein
MFRVSRRLAFRWILPIAQLVLSVGILWPVRHELAQQVQDSIRFSRLSKTRAPTVNEVLAIVIPERLTPEQKSEFNRFETRKWLPSVLNLPSGLIQLPYVILSPSKEERVPVGLDVLTWRAVSWPLLGLLFWWSAGRGIDALLATRQRRVQPKISWVEAVTGIALFLFCAIVAICFPIFSHGDHDPDFPLKLFSCGFGMWALLAGVVVLAKFRQWRILRFLLPKLCASHSDLGQ